MRMRLLSLVAVLIFTGAGCINFGSSKTQGPMGMFRSGDGGESWQQINAVPTQNGVASLSGVRVYKIFTDPTDPNALYAGTRENGLFYSYNNGGSWTKVEAFGNRFIYSVAVDPKDKCTIFVTDGAEIFKTTDCSRTWDRVYTEQRGEKIVGVAIDYGSSNTVFAASASGQILRSTNAGQSWRSIKTFSANLQHIAADPFKAGRVYVAGQNSGLVRSDDAGDTWLSLTQGLQNFADSLNFYRFVYHPTEKNTIYWLSKYGILVSKDAGQTWSDLKLLSPPGSVSIYSFAVNPSNTNEMYYTGTIFGEGTVSRSTFYKSTDGGNNWVTKKLPTNTVPVGIHVHSKETSTLFMGFAVPDEK